MENGLWKYIYSNCKCQYINHERAYSAYITMCGYDYQEYELSEDYARKKLANAISKMECANEWYNKLK